MPISAEREVAIISPGRIKSPSSRMKRRLMETDLDFSGQETQYSTHALHPYIAAINPPLARALLEAYVPPGQNVLDPFCGGGGVLVESMLTGRDSAGFDVNPLAAIISKAKTAHLTKPRIRTEYKRIQAHAHYLAGEVKPQVSEFAEYWFRPENLVELAVLSQAVRECIDDELRNLFCAILSATIRDTMLTYRGEVRLRKLRGRDYERFQPNVWEIFQKRTDLAMDRVSALPTKVNATVTIGDARNVPLADKTFYSVICSPPYADDTHGVGYFQFSRYMLELLGFSPNSIKEYRSSFLGTVKEEKTLPPSMTLHASARNVEHRSRKHYYAATAFYADYYQALSEMKRVAIKWIVIVIGNRVLSRTLFDNANITIELFKSLNVPLIDYYSRNLRKKRIPDLGSDGGGGSTEHILVFQVE